MDRQAIRQQIVGLSDALLPHYFWLYVFAGMIAFLSIHALITLIQRSLDSGARREAARAGIAPPEGQSRRVARRAHRTALACLSEAHREYVAKDNENLTFQLYSRDEGGAWFLIVLGAMISAIVLPMLHGHWGQPPNQTVGGEEVLRDIAWGIILFGLTLLPLAMGIYRLRYTTQFVRYNLGRPRLRLDAWGLEYEGRFIAWDEIKRCETISVEDKTWPGFIVKITAQPASQMAPLNIDCANFEPEAAMARKELARPDHMAYWLAARVTYGIAYALSRKMESSNSDKGLDSGDSQ